jgi:DNA-binding transcriptional regulator LsrR (DeoR family)
VPINTQGNVVVQLAGSLGFNDSVYDGLELAKTLAKKINAECYAINAPFLLQDLKGKALLSKEPQIKATLALMEKLEISLTGISSNKPEESVLVKGGFLTWQESCSIYDAGSVGHICGMHITKDGRLHETETNQHIMGIGFNQFKKIPHKITVSSGEDRVPSIAAALKGSLIDTLITDEQTVEALLNYK